MSNTTETVLSYVATAAGALGLGRAWQWLAGREKRLGAEAAARARVDVAKVEADAEAAQIRWRADEATGKHALDLLDSAHERGDRAHAALVDCERRTAAAEARAARAEARAEELDRRVEALEEGIRARDRAIDEITRQVTILMNERAERASNRPSAGPLTP